MHTHTLTHTDRPKTNTTHTHTYKHAQLHTHIYTHVLVTRDAQFYFAPHQQGCEPQRQLLFDMYFIARRRYKSVPSGYAPQVQNFCVHLHSFDGVGGGGVAGRGGGVGGVWCASTVLHSVTSHPCPLSKLSDWSHVVGLIAAHVCARVLLPFVSHWDEFT